MGITGSYSLFWDKLKWPFEEQQVWQLASFFGPMGCRLTKRHDSTNATVWLTSAKTPQQRLLLKKEKRKRNCIVGYTTRRGYLIIWLLFTAQFLSTLYSPSPYWLKLKCGKVFWQVISLWLTTLPSHCEGCQRATHLLPASCDDAHTQKTLPGLPFNPCCGTTGQHSRITFKAGCVCVCVYACICVCASVSHAGVCVCMRTHW